MKRAVDLFSIVFAQLTRCRPALKIHGAAGDLVTVSKFGGLTVRNGKQ